jgi:hypothetical protein
MEVSEMGSASVNPGVSDLLQTLSNLNSPVLSSPKVVAALETAPTSDIVELSMEATQLEGMDALFGISDGSSGSSTDPSSILASLESTLAGSNDSTATAPSSSSASSAASPATQLAGYQASLQSEETQALLGGATGSTLNGSLFNLTG